MTVSIRTVAEAALANQRAVLVETATAELEAWLGEPEGLNLEVCHVDVDEQLVVATDGEIKLARRRDGDVYLVTLEEGDGGPVRVVTVGQKLADVSDLGRRLTEAGA